jgi:hypothetical protein
MQVDVTEFQQDDDEGHETPPQLDDDKYWDDYR